MFLLVDFRVDERGTLFLNLFSALDDPVFLLLIAGHDATNVLVVVLAVVVAVVDENDEAVVVAKALIEGILVVETNEFVCKNPTLSISSFAHPFAYSNFESSFCGRVLKKI